MPDGVVSRAPGAEEAQWLRGALGLLLCLTGGLEQEPVPIYFGSAGTDGGKCASGSVWDVLELLRPLCGQHASAEVRAKFYPPFQLGCSGDAAALWPKPSLSSPRTWGWGLHLVPVQRVGGWLGIVQTTQQRVAAMKTCCRGDHKRFGAVVCVCESQMVAWKAGTFCELLLLAEGESLSPRAPWWRCHFCSARSALDGKGISQQVLHLCRAVALQPCQVQGWVRCLPCQRV